MKKILALVMAMAMLLVSASAFAAAAYSYTEYNYDETMFAEITGEWIGLDGLGLMLYMPDIYVASEVTADLAEVGIVALFGAVDGNGAVSISYGPAVDAAGNGIASIEDLAAYYSSVGATNVDVIIVNGIPVVSCLLEANDMVNYGVLFEGNTQCIMSFTPASDANTTLMGALTITSLMAME